MDKNRISRRSFIAQAGAGAVAFTIMNPKLVKSYAANEKVSVGIIGCGRRGGWLADLIKENGGYDIAGCADYFKDKADEVGNKHNIPAEMRFTGLNCYKRLLENKIDAVAIISPAYFHPEQAAAAVEAGKHVYIAKPVAIDVPGCKSIETSGQKATSRKLCFLVDFQTRVDEYYKECIKRVHAGAIGKFVFGECTYHADRAFPGFDQILAQDPSNHELRLKAWGLFKSMSGDMITEQNIHAIDVMSWIMDTEPVCAIGTGGRTVKTDAGDCWDHFVLTFEYPNNVGVSFSSRQFNGYGTQPDGARNRMFGTKGVLETEYGGQTMIRGSKENFYRGGISTGIYKQGAKTNIADFRRNIIEGSFANETVAPSVQSNLVTILGRTAAYQGRKVTWAEVLRDNTVLEPAVDFSRLKS